MDIWPMALNSGAESLNSGALAGVNVKPSSVFLFALALAALAETAATLNNNTIKTSNTLLFLNNT
jgi:hypothetical protein